MSTDHDEKLYTQTEILQSIYGLMNVYWSKNWIGRLFGKPWYDALSTLALQLAGNSIIEEMDAREAKSEANSILDQWENQLDADTGS